MDKRGIYYDVDVSGIRRPKVARDKVGLIGVGRARLRPAEAGISRVQFTTRSSRRERVIEIKQRDDAGTAGALNCSTSTAQDAHSVIAARATVCGRNFT